MGRGWLLLMRQNHFRDSIRQLLKMSKTRRTLLRLVGVADHVMGVGGGGGGGVEEVVAVAVGGGHGGVPGWGLVVMAGGVTHRGWRVTGHHIVLIVEVLHLTGVDWVPTPMRGGLLGSHMLMKGHIDRGVLCTSGRSGTCRVRVVSARRRFGLDASLLLL